MAEDKYAGEALSDEELNGVAGGTFLEILNDVNEFEKFGEPVSNNRTAGLPMLMENLRNTFKKYGVELKDNGDLVGDLLGTSKANKYFIGNNEVSRAQAWEHIKSQFNN